MFSLRVMLEEVCEPAPGVGPPLRNATAVETPPFVSDVELVPSIILVVEFGGSSTLRFFPRAAVVAAFCLAASAGGRVRTLAPYSLLVLETNPALSASLIGSELSAERPFSGVV